MQGIQSFRGVTGVCVVLLLCVPLAQCISQSVIDFIAYNVIVTAEVTDNLENGNASHEVLITLTNEGLSDVHELGWTLYFHSIYLLFPSVFPKTRHHLIKDAKVNVSMVQGDLYAMEPTADFGTLVIGETRTIRLTVAFWSVSRTDFMPRWYVSAPGRRPRMLKATESLDYVQPFDEAKQWKRYPDDRYDPFTAQDLSKRLGVADLGQIGIEHLVVPTPLSIKAVGDGARLGMAARVTLYLDCAGLENVCKYLTDVTQLPKMKRPSDNQIRLGLEDLAMKPGSYKLTMDPSSKTIKIKGQDSDGVFNGIQTLLSLMASYSFEDMPLIAVTDEPRYGHRGMHIDVARNFHSMAEIKRLLQSMATYKLNKLHFHLSDDEGWRLEIPGLPELTQIGGKRCHDLTHTKCIIPQFGSGPATDTSGSGFYTVKEYKEILEYAKVRHIEVIPEFDMPAHAHAAIISMESRFERILRETGNETHADKFRLVDPDDRSEYISAQNWRDNAINPCIESTYAFIQHLASAVRDMHGDVQPMKVFHFGGNEVAEGAWMDSPKCIEFLTTNPAYNVSKGLKKYFAERVAKIANYLSLGLRGWEDMFTDGDGTPFRLGDLGYVDVSVNAWNNIWEWGAAKRAYKFANAGYKVVMSQSTHLNFDHPYDPDPEERGLYWATRFTDTKKVFSFLPDALYDNIDVKRSGEPLTRPDVCGAKGTLCDKLERPDRIIGIQGHLWSETVRTSAHLDYMLFPRLLALAERAWHKADFEQETTPCYERKTLIDRAWEKFANTLGHKELDRLEKEGIKYRVPPPGAEIKSGVAMPTVTFPGLSIEYKRLGDPSFQAVPSTGISSLQCGEAIVLRTRSTKGRYSREVKVMDSRTWVCTIIKMLLKNVSM